MYKNNRVAPLKRAILSQIQYQWELNVYVTVHGTVTFDDICAQIGSQNVLTVRIRG